MRPKELCEMCSPGWPCPWCVDFLGMLAWELAHRWEEEEASAALRRLLLSLSAPNITIAKERIDRWLR